MPRARSGPVSLLCREVWYDCPHCDVTVSSPTWRHDDHPGWYVVGGSPLRRQHFVVDDLPEEVLAELWVDPDVVFGSHSMDAASLARLLDAEWDYSSLHPSRLITALVCLDQESMTLRRLAGLTESDPISTGAVLWALWSGAAGRAGTALGLAYRQDTPVDLLGAIIEWCQGVPDPAPEVCDAMLCACQGGPIEIVRSAARAMSPQACAALVRRPEPLRARDAAICSQVLVAAYPSAVTAAVDYRGVLLARQALEALAKREGS